MPSDDKAPRDAEEEATSDAAALGRRPLPAAAQRALAEAAARRAQHAGKPAEQSAELHGRGGLDPTRYGDWEINGLAADFLDNLLVYQKIILA
jgi:hypothetical protein